MVPERQIQRSLMGLMIKVLLALVSGLDSYEIRRE